MLAFCSLDLVPAPVIPNTGITTGAVLHRDRRRDEARADPTQGRRRDEAHRDPTQGRRRDVAHRDPAPDPGTTDAAAAAPDPQPDVDHDPDPRYGTADHLHRVADVGGIVHARDDGG